MGGYLVLRLVGKMDLMLERHLADLKGGKLGHYLGFLMVLNLVLKMVVHLVQRKVDASVNTMVKGSDYLKEHPKEVM